MVKSLPTTTEVVGSNPPQCIRLGRASMLTQLARVQGRVTSVLSVCLCRFADTEVRSVAVSWIESSTDDELADYLPQLVQGLSLYFFIFICFILYVLHYGPACECLE